MSSEGWIALAALGLPLLMAVAVASAWISGRLAKVEAKLENGISASLKKLEKSVDKLSDKWTNAPCTEHAVKMEDCERRLDALE